MNQTPKPSTASLAVLLGYPFRPFFLLTALYALVLIIAWVLFLFAGLPLPLDSNPLQWHAHEMLFGVIPAAIAGFVLTAMCNWTGAQPLRGGPLLLLLASWLAGRVVMWGAGFLPGWLVAAVDLAFLSVVAGYVAHVLVRFGNRRNHVLVWLLVLLASANLLMHLGFLDLWPAASRLGEVLALDVIALFLVVIGGRITPAFTANWLRMQGRASDRVVHSESLDRVVFWVTMGMVPADFAIGTPELGAAVALAAAVVNGWRIYWWRGWQAASEPLLWILHVGMAWIVLALWLKGLTPWFELPPSVWMHTMGVGAIGTMILGVMTRVGLGHTGRILQLPRFAVWIYVAILMAAPLRLMAVLMPALATFGIVTSALAWTVAFGLFLVVYWPILSQPRADGRPG
ncbi:MAG: NnrS family protein [Pseudomonadota bacterium]|nr:NnrS family protein [Pseudomonadota bacterium]